jgi:PAS domain S-box-containing protein
MSDPDESHSQLVAVLESSPDAIILAKLDGEITYWNSGAERMYGYSADEAIGQPIFILTPSDKTQMLQIVERLRRGHRLDTYETSRLRKDGSPIDVAVTASATRGPDGEATGILAITRDITERNRMESALREAIRAAEQANLAKSEFLSRISHELRTPMNAILGFAQLLQMDSNLSEEQIDSVDQILKGGRHLLDLINEVLDLARVEAGRLSLSLEPVCVAEVLEDALGLMRPLAQGLGAALELQPLPPHLYIRADKQRFRQVLLNLISNAIKYNSRSGTVKVVWEKNGKNLRLEVRDTGAGISPERMARLFTPFERLGAERGRTEGTGLGLALSKKLVEAMAGQIGVSSTVGKGSCFWLEFKVQPSPSGFISNVRKSAWVSLSEKTGTVLYVEDNLSNLRLVERILSDWPGIHLVSAMQGSLAVDLALQHAPRLILLDLHLPDINGDLVLEALRNEPKTAAIPVVILSADATDGQVKRLLAAGATSYMTKPIDVARFLSLLRDHL